MLNFFLSKKDKEEIVLQIIKQEIIDLMFNHQTYDYYVNSHIV